jgi:RND family efflux transporter MFP subunit
LAYCDTIRSNPRSLTTVGPSAVVRVTVEEARIGLVRPGQAVRLDVPAYPNQTFTGRGTTIAPTGDTRAHTFDVRVVPDDNEGRLMPVMVAQVRVTAAERTMATLIPKEAVIQQDGGPIAYVVEEGRARVRFVQVGVSDEKNTEIVSGIHPGEKVVTIGTYGLQDNQAVRLPGERPPSDAPPADHADDGHGHVH